MDNVAQVDDNNEWFAMLDQIERDGADYHLEKMAELHALEVETEGRVRFIRITDDNPHGD
jgi:hypothetical protein